MSFQILYSETYKFKKKRRLHREFKCGVLHGKTSPVRFVINEIKANRSFIEFFELLGVAAINNFLNCPIVESISDFVHFFSLLNCSAF